MVVIGIMQNGKYEAMAVRPFFCGEEYELRVLTWNVHRSAIADEGQLVEMAKEV